MSASAAIAPKPYLVPYVLSFDLPPTPKGRTRCRHLMLDRECSWCLGIEEPEGIVAVGQ